MLNRVPVWIVVAAVGVFLAASAAGCTDTGNGGGGNNVADVGGGGYGGGGNNGADVGGGGYGGGGGNNGADVGGSGGGGGCEPGYDPCVPAYPPDVDCADLGTGWREEADGGITVTGNDPHLLDMDADGKGCEL
jgi:hypothetical protein